jgi:hypothetical protein
MNPQDIMNQFNKFKADMERQNPGKSPQDIVNDMVRSGKVSQQQFEQARGIASMLGIRM